MLRQHRTASLDIVSKIMLSFSTVHWALRQVAPVTGKVTRSCSGFRVEFYVWCSDTFENPLILHCFVNIQLIATSTDIVLIMDGCTSLLTDDARHRYPTPCLNTQSIHPYFNVVLPPEQSFHSRQRSQGRQQGPANIPRV